MDVQLGLARLLRTNKQYKQSQKLYERYLDQLV